MTDILDKIDSVMYYPILMIIGRDYWEWLPEVIIGSDFLE